jgi:hypothetical protein
MAQPKRGGLLRKCAGSLIVAAILLSLDVIIGGNCMFSSVLCPLWGIGSIVKNLVSRTEWRLTLVRLGIPAVCFIVSVGNHYLQCEIADTNGKRVVAACEEFHAATGRYPETLEELVPHYLKSIPRAKYCLSHGDFVYWRKGSSAFGLKWYLVHPMARVCYASEQKRWFVVD